MTGKKVEYKTYCDDGLLTALVSHMFDKGVTRMELLDGLIVIVAVEPKPRKTKVQP